MQRSLEFLLELLGVGSIGGLLAFVTWTKITLGRALTFLGAFFPKLRSQKEPPQKQVAQIKLWTFLVRMSGGLRLGVVVAGLILVIGAVIDGHRDYVEDAQRRRAENQREMVRWFLLLNQAAQTYELEYLPGERLRRRQSASP